MNNDLIYEMLLEKYFQSIKGQLKISTIYDKEKIFEKHITPFFKFKNLNTLSKQELLCWLNSKNKYSINYRRKLRASLNHFFNFCEVFYDVPNKLKLLPTAKNYHAKKSMQFFDYTNWRKFQEVISTNILWDTFFNFLYYTGLRVGEANALSDKDIDMRQHVVKVTKNITRKVSYQKYVVTTPKNNSSIRDIKLPKTLLDKLRDFYLYKKQFKISSKFLFGGNNPLSEKKYTYNFKKYCKLANLPQIRIHDLRHSHASLLINKGANVLLVAQRLGHSNPSITLNIYSKLFESSEKEIIQKLNKL